MRVVVGLALLAAPLALAPAGEPTQRELLEAVEKQLKAVAEKAGPSVACVVVSRSESYPKPAAPPDYPGRLGGFDPKEFLKANPAKVELARRLDLADRANIPDHGFAGGVVIDQAGLVLTTFHSLEGATKIYVHLPDGKGSYADIQAADGRIDLAVLKLLTPPDGLTPIRFGEVRLPHDPKKATVAAGKLVVLLAGVPAPGFAPGRPSAALGALSNVRYRFPEPNGQPRSETVYSHGAFLEYDVRLYPGTSGGALLNLDGELVGLTTANAAVTGGENAPGYALPMDPNIRRIVEVLRRGEEVEYGFLGVSLGTNPVEIVIEQVTPQSPAAAAGLRVRDRIVRIDDVDTRNFADLLFYGGSALAGSKVKLTVLRDGQPRDVELTLAKYRNTAPFIASVRPDPVFGLRVDYGSILSQKLADARAGGPVVPPGVVVREVVPDSPAAARFKAIGDEGKWVITHVNGVPTPTPADFYKAAKGQPSVKLTLADPTEFNAKPRELTLP